MTIILSKFARNNNHTMLRKAILDAMEKKGVRQVELAEHLGITRVSVSNYLSGKRKISVEHIEKALVYLGLEIVLKDK